MASVSSVSSSNSNSSLYGSRNVMSGLASGLDTESMIENAVSGYQTKITTLQQNRTVNEWKQEAYRSIISKMASFNSKYSSYSSKTNLMSASFFNKAVLTTATGDNASKVTASGKSTSEIQINAINQLAKAARYTVSGSNLGSSASVPTITASEEVSLSETMELSNLSGYMTLNYGNKTVSINFGELETYSTAQELSDAISSKLSEQTITTTSGDTVKANTLIGVSVADDGTISFSDQNNAGNSVYISSASAGIQSALGFTAGTTASSFPVDETKLVNTDATVLEYLSGKTMSVNLDGTTKSITLPTDSEISQYRTDNAGTNEADAYTALLQSKLNSSFGSGKISVSNTAATSGNLKLSFTISEGSTMKISADAGDALGIGSEATSYLNTSATLESTGVLSGLTAKEDGTYDFVLNGVTIGSYSKDTALETVLSAINNNTEAGVNVSYSKTTNEFVFTAKNTGVSEQITFGSGLASAMFGSGTFETGQDAQFTATINGKEMSLTRSSNSVELDGMTITLKGTFDSSTEAIDFTTTADADTIVDAIKSMVEDYNEMVTEIRSAATTLPAQKTDGSKYLPLTDEDSADMTESAITAYEEKAKQGLLFGDSDLSALYSKLRSAVTPSGTDGTTLRSIGITTNYSSGLTTLELDEDKLRAALESNPDTVKEIFTKTADVNGSGTNGLMQNLKTQLDNYASTTGATKGILVQKAGTPLSSLSLLSNTLQSKIEDIDEEIETWQTKLSNKVDYYTSKFTALEQLISEMNSQSSTLSSMLGS